MHRVLHPARRRLGKSRSEKIKSVEMSSLYIFLFDFIFLFSPTIREKNFRVKTFAHRGSEWSFQLNDQSKTARARNFFSILFFFFHFHSIQTSLLISSVTVSLHIVLKEFFYISYTQHHFSLSIFFLRYQYRFAHTRW